MRSRKSWTILSVATSLVAAQAFAPKSIAEKALVYDCNRDMCTMKQLIYRCSGVGVSLLRDGNKITRLVRGKSQCHHSHMRLSDEWAAEGRLFFSYTH